MAMVVQCCRGMYIVVRRSLYESECSADAIRFLTQEGRKNGMKSLNSLRKQSI